MNAQMSSINAEWLEISCAKRREIIHDGLTAASMQQIFAPETSSHSALMDCFCSRSCPATDTRY